MADKLVVEDREWYAGEVRTVGGRLVGRCLTCGELVRMDKAVLGSLHFCLDTTTSAAGPPKP